MGNLLGVVCEPDIALIRWGSCDSSRELDGLAQEEDASERARSGVGVETLISASQSPENQSVCCNVSTDEVERVIKNTFLQVVRSPVDRVLGTVVLEAGVYQREFR